MYIDKSDEMSECMADRMPEYVQDRVPEYIYIYIWHTCTYTC